MQATKLERIIFDERDIRSLERQAEEALRYVNGEIDLYSKFATILSDAERLISIISEQTDFSQENRLLFNLWDDEYYYQYEGYDNFIQNFIKNGDYAQILREAALDLFRCKIEICSPENKLIEHKKMIEEIYIAESMLAAKLANLSPFEKLELRLLRKSPTARINSSPSFIFAAGFGEAMIQGFKEGIEKNP